MKLGKYIVNICQAIHAWITADDTISIFDEHAYAVRLAFQLQEAPLHPARIAQEKRRLINRDADPARMFSLMKFC